MPESQTSYKQVMKATSLFGGVQVFNIIISVARSKAIAIFLGPAGMGIAGLFNAAIGLISVCTNLGLDTSGVKSISATQDDEGKLRTTIAILKRLIWFTGTFGALATIAFSPLLSRITFGNSHYTFGFIWISITVLFRQLSNGQLSVLQGLRKLRQLAKANLLGSFFGLIFTVPLYYFWGIDAIVAGIVVATAVSLFFTWIYSRNVNLQAVEITNKEAFTEGKEMMKLGISLSFISLLTTFSAYALQIFISRNSGFNEVGLFNAGFALINSYVGMVFTAMSTDYFPRLSAIASDSLKVRETVQQQAFIAILITTPIIIVFLALAPFIVHILYSKAFLPIVAMVSWGILGMAFKAVSWSMGYILLAKGDSKMFMRTSLGFNAAFLLINILGYTVYGLEGLGITFLINYVIHFFGLKMITSKRYEFYFTNAFYKIFALCLFFCAIAFLFSYISNPFYKYPLLLVMSIISCVYSFHELDKKTGMRHFIKSKMKKS